MKSTLATNHPPQAKPAGRLVARFAMVVTAVVLVAGLSWRLSAQETPTAASNDQPSLGRVKDFLVPDYFDPPNQNQMKSLLRGAEAQPQPNGRVLIKELQLETFATNGKSVMIVRAPDCIYDQAGQTATSSNHIEASSGDGKLFVEGQGFRWDQTNSLFTISNNVHTTILQEPEKAATP